MKLSEVEKQKIRGNYLLVHYKDISKPLALVNSLPNAEKTSTKSALTVLCNRYRLPTMSAKKCHLARAAS